MTIYDTAEARYQELMNALPPWARKCFDANPGVRLTIKNMILQWIIKGEMQ